MFFNRFDSYYYSRPVAYRSYYPKLTKPSILSIEDPDSQKVLNYLRQQGYNPTDRGGLHRGILFDDFEVGKRHYNHNNACIAPDEFYIHQWKPTNDLSDWHPTGTHLVFKTYDEFMNKLNQIVQERKKKF